MLELRASHYMLELRASHYMLELEIHGSDGRDGYGVPESMRASAG